MRYCDQRTMEIAEELSWMSRSRKRAGASLCGTCTHGSRYASTDETRRDETKLNSTVIRPTYDPRDGRVKEGTVRMDEERRAKRSRFDDRPRSERRRSASPETKVEDVAAVAAAAAAPPVSDAVLAAKKKAAEAAARISAMLKNKKASSPAVTPKPPSASPAPRPPPDEVNEQGLYVR